MADQSENAILFSHAAVPAAYERYMGSQMFAPWAERLLDFAAIPAGAHVLDVAAGTGIVSRAIAERVGPSGQVTSTDISPVMLGFARSLAPEDAPITFLVSSADALDVPDSSQDFVVCQQGLQFFPDPRAALTEMRRVLKPGGTVALAVWDEDHPLGVFGPLRDELMRVAPQPERRNPNSFRMDRSTLDAFVREAGFDDVRTEAQSLDARWSSLADAVNAIKGTPWGELVAGLPPDARSEVEGAMAAQFDRSAQDGSVTCRTYSVLARGRRG